MGFLNVDGLPEAVVRALEDSIDRLRHALQRKSTPQPATQIDVRPGTVYGRIDREMIYEDRSGSGRGGPPSLIAMFMPFRLRFRY